MRVIETKVLTFNELSDEAKEKAIEKFREHQEFDFVLDEIADTMRALAELLGVRITSYEIGYDRSCHISWDSNYSDEVLNLSGIRLSKYLSNNFWNNIYKGRYSNICTKEQKKITHKRVKSTDYKNGNIGNSYYSAVFFESCCPLTGYCYDNDVLDIIIRQMNNFSDITFNEIIEECFDKILEIAENEVIAMSDDDYIRNELIDRDYEFTEDGELI